MHPYLWQKAACHMDSPDSTVHQGHIPRSHHGAEQVAQGKYCVMELLHPPSSDPSPSYLLSPGPSPSYAVTLPAWSFTILHLQGLTPYHPTLSALTLHHPTLLPDLTPHHPTLLALTPPHPTLPAMTTHHPTLPAIASHHPTLPALIPHHSTLPALTTHHPTLIALTILQSPSYPHSPLHLTLIVLTILPSQLSCYPYSSPSYHPSPDHSPS